VTKAVRQIDKINTVSPIDILVNNAGIHVGTAESTEEDMDRDLP
jgi:NAD(P)-dependent dehydrogenase (short-subunit alcohol dehydrogenase family)